MWSTTTSESKFIFSNLTSALVLSRDKLGEAVLMTKVMRKKEELQRIAHFEKVLLLEKIGLMVQHTRMRYLAIHQHKVNKHIIGPGQFYLFTLAASVN